MKIFSWMQDKLNGKDRRSKPNSASADNIMHQTCKEEFSDWPNGLLSIGTFGNSALKHTENSNIQQNLSSCKDQPKDNLKSEKYIHCLPSLEHSKTSDDESINGDSENKDGHLQQSTSVVPSRELDIRLQSTSNSIGKKSLSFLFKKALVCGGGFSSTPILRDPFLEPKLDKSRMEKILGAILQKKIYPQSSTQMATAKKYLDMPESESESESEGSKWVKTDSEYIVLEI